MNQEAQSLVSLPAGELVTIPTQDGGQLRCVVSGEGPPVVLAHGYIHDVGSNNLIRSLLNEQGFKVYGFEQRGHGASSIGSDGVSAKVMARDYGDVLSHFELKDAVLFAHSMGGFLAITFHIEYPELANRHLKGVVIASSHAGQVARKNPQNRVLATLIQLRFGRLIFNTPVLNSAISKTVFGKNPSP